MHKEGVKVTGATSSMRTRDLHNGVLPQHHSSQGGSTSDESYHIRPYKSTAVVDSREKMCVVPRAFRGGSKLDAWLEKAGYWCCNLQPIPSHPRLDCHTPHFSSRPPNLSRGTRSRTSFTVWPLLPRDNVPPASPARRALPSLLDTLLMILVARLVSRALKASYRASWPTSSLGAKTLDREPPAMKSIMLLSAPSDALWMSF